MVDPNLRNYKYFLDQEVYIIKQVKDSPINSLLQYNPKYTLENWVLGPSNPYYVTTRRHDSWWNINHYELRTKLNEEVKLEYVEERDIFLTEDAAKLECISRNINKLLEDIEEL